MSVAVHNCVFKKACVTMLLILFNNCRNNGGDDWGEKRQQRSKFGSEDESRGREGGRSVRSIASNKDSDTREKSVASSDMDDWGAMSTSSSGISTKSPEPTSSFDNSFNIAAWGDSLSAATGGAKKKNSEEKVPDKRSSDADEGFERYGSYLVNIRPSSSNVYQFQIRCLLSNSYPFF